MRFAIAILWLASTVAFAQKVEIAFTIPEKDLIPEGIAYDSMSDAFFVSSIAQRKIVKIDARKKISDFTPSTNEGLGEVLGLKVVAGKLWACNNADGKSMVHQFDIASGRLLKKWTFEAAGEKHLFNDIAVTANGEAFISDSDAGQVFRVSGELEVPELWAKDSRLRDINGIALLNRNYVVVNASTGFFKIHRTTREISTLAFDGYYPLGIDGLSRYKNSLIGIQNVVFPVSINRYFLNARADGIEGARVLVSNHPRFNIPTTGVVVGQWFYFVANSQLLNYDGRIKDPAKLQEVLIMRVSLD